MELSILVNKFNLKGRLVALQPFGNGNINDTTSGSTATRLPRRRSSCRR